MDEKKARQAMADARELGYDDEDLSELEKQMLELNAQSLDEQAQKMASDPISSKDFARACDAILIVLIQEKLGMFGRLEWSKLAFLFKDDTEQKKRLDFITGKGLMLAQEVDSKIFVETGPAWNGLVNGYVGLVDRFKSESVKCRMFDMMIRHDFGRLAFQMRIEAQKEQQKRQQNEQRQREKDEREAMVKKELSRLFDKQTKKSASEQRRREQNRINQQKFRESKRLGKKAKKELKNAGEGNWNAEDGWSG